MVVKSYFDILEGDVDTDVREDFRVVSLIILSCLNSSR